MDTEVTISFLSILPSLLWFILAIVLLFVFRGAIRQLTSAIIWRVKSGAQVKIASFEIGESYVSPAPTISRGKLIDILEDEDQQRYRERGQYYIPNRDLFLVHKLAPSEIPNQLYDILIYLIPHKNATLACVQKVEYYFGPHWDNKIFVSTDRASGFAISTSAYGPFVCTAKLHFTDGNSTMIWRYIDFEMGPIGKG
ncbi:MAG: hypothetical protein NZ481_09725 [Candidatus Kapabacteria bacterium]|nr:hypothetical protein [Candidatus Kapabacteria bacterium]